MRLPKNKLALIHVAKARLKLSDEDYRRLLDAIGGVTSAKYLSEAAFGDLMHCFKVLGFESHLAQATYGDRPGMATPPQVAVIKTLWQRWAGNYDVRELNHWLEHFFHVSSLRFLDRESAAKAVTALKQMEHRRSGSDG